MGGLLRKLNDFEVINPSNEEPFAKISLGYKEDTDAAVKTAKKCIYQMERNFKRRTNSSFGEITYNL